MSRKKSKEEIQFNMSQVRNKNTSLENIICTKLQLEGVTTFIRNDKNVFGHPDITFPAKKIAVFCDGDFWHGYDWEKAKEEIKSNRQFWINKIERNIHRDLEVNIKLESEGWLVLRFWGHQIKKDSDYCVSVILNKLRKLPKAPYKTIDLCAGIGGIRRGFELTRQFENVLSAETDKYACKTYFHLFGEDPKNDLTTEEFKSKVAEKKYDFLLAGFPCQTFSRVGFQEGFNNEEKGQIFFHIADIIKKTRPIGFFLENVDRITTHDNGKTFKIIADTLVNKLGYYVIGITKQEDGTLQYSAKNFIRNSKDFGVPQNRPRAYLIGFDTECFPKDRLNALPNELPTRRFNTLYKDLNSVLEHNVNPKYYMASGYLDTLIRHRKREENKGNGFGYRIVNDERIENPIANALLATGGSGRERNLICDPCDGISGLYVKGKKTPLNEKGIRVMTPNEWGKLQGFVNYAFLDKDNNDMFSFPKEVSDVQRYKQLGNTVTIPVVEEMAKFILRCMKILQEKQ